MEHSGDVVDLSPLGEHTKHSTGGVDDKTARPVPDGGGVRRQNGEMSGRGLGHRRQRSTSSNPSPGFSTAMTPEKFLEKTPRTSVL